MEYLKDNNINFEYQPNISFDYEYNNKIHKYKPDFAVSEDETEAGEYYIDTLCVMPEYRKMGIATKLITTIREQVFAEGHRKLGLIVDIDNPTAERLYTSLGFRRVGMRIFAGHKMWHLVNE